LWPPNGWWSSEHFWLYFCLLTGWRVGDKGEQTAGIRPSSVLNWALRSLYRRANVQLFGKLWWLVQNKQYNNTLLANVCWRGCWQRISVVTTYDSCHHLSLNLSYVTYTTVTYLLWKSVTGIIFEIGTKKLRNYNQHLYKCKECFGHTSRKRVK